MMETLLHTTVFLFCLAGVSYCSLHNSAAFSNVPQDAKNADDINPRAASLGLRWRAAAAWRRLPSICRCRRRSRLHVRHTTLSPPSPTLGALISPRAANSSLPLSLGIGACVHGEQRTAHALPHSPFSPIPTQAALAVRPNTDRDSSAGLSLRASTSPREKVTRAK